MFRRILKWLYALLFFVTPLIVLPMTSELFEFNKMLVIYFIAMTVGVVWVIESIRSKQFIFKRTILDIPLGLFLLSQVISTFFSIDVHTSLFGYYGRFNGGLISIIAYLVLYFGFVSHFSFSDVKFFLKTSVITSIIVMAWGLPGKFGHDLSCLLFTHRFDNTCWTDQFRPAERMFSTLGQPDWLGAYLGVHFFIGVYYFLIQIVKRPVNVRNYLLSVLYIFFTFICILFTRSRSAEGAILIAFVPLVLYTILIFRHNPSVKKPVLIFIMGILLAICIARTGIDRIDSIIELRFLAHQSAVVKTVKPVVPAGPITDSFDIRKIVWKGAINLAKRYPLFGTGPETFAYSYYFTRPAAHNLTSEWDFLYNKAHNEYLNYLATTGIFGFVTYVAISFFITFFSLRELRRLWLKDSSRSREFVFILCLYLAYVTVLITNFFGFSTTTLQLYFYLIPAMLILYAVRERTLPQAEPTNVSQKAGIFFVSVFYLFLCFSLVVYFYADILFAQSDNLIRQRDYATAAQVVNTALKLRYEHVYQDTLGTILAQLAYVAAYQKEPAVAQKLASLSTFYTDQSIKASPYNEIYLRDKVKNLYFLYQINFDPSYLKQGLDVLSHAAKLGPTDPKIPYSQALFYSLLEDETTDEKEKLFLAQQSLFIIDRAIALKPDYEDAYLLKAQLLKKYKQNKEALKTYQEILNRFDPHNAEVLKEMQDLQ